MLKITYDEAIKQGKENNIKYIDENNFVYFKESDMPRKIRNLYRASLKTEETQILPVEVETTTTVKEKNIEDTNFHKINSLGNAVPFKEKKINKVMNTTKVENIEEKVETPIRATSHNINTETSPYSSNSISMSGVLAGSISILIGFIIMNFKEGIIEFFLNGAVVEEQSKFGNVELLESILGSMLSLVPILFIIVGILKIFRNLSD